MLGRNSIQSQHLRRETEQVEHRPFPRASARGVTGCTKFGPTRKRRPSESPLSPSALRMALRPLTAAATAVVPSALSPSSETTPPTLPPRFSTTPSLTPCQLCSRYPGRRMNRNGQVLVLRQPVAHRDCLFFAYRHRQRVRSCEPNPFFRHNRTLPQVHRG
ncbi:hypothetical protein M407DRAFT_217427 [Tulasnella calospora MUT 4182]|uniref:Uncharacterized protein n=1 Tax=Tulasnella calospora MUT 4182 TaxID=1051891 RepID=A0A0C3Q1A0_9AGAM|nr:hypothetical protein M407DRAFT_217427 [Tulasnella calospora MUT 4182]